MIKKVFRKQGRDRKIVNPIAEKIIAKYRRRGEVIKYITRFDYGRNYGWNVRVPDNKSRLHSAWFGDGGIGANEQQIELSFVQAIMERDRLCLLLGTPIVDAKLFRIIRNKTGYYGISEVEYKEKKFRQNKWKFYKYCGFRATHIKPDGTRIVKDARITKRRNRQQAIELLTQWLIKKDFEKYGMKIERQVDARKIKTALR